MDIAVPDRGHGDDGEVERGDVAGEQVHLPEADVPGAPEREAADPGAALARRRQRGGEVVEDAGGGVREVELHGDELHDAREEVADPDVLLHPLEEGQDVPGPVQAQPHQAPHHLRPPRRLVYEVPWEAAEDVKSEASFDVAVRAQEHQKLLGQSNHGLRKKDQKNGDDRGPDRATGRPAWRGLTAERSCACRTPSGRCGRPCRRGRSGRRRRRGRRAERTRGPAGAPGGPGRSRTRMG